MANVHSLTRLLRDGEMRMARTINSDFAILDVKRGRKGLAKRIEAGETRIPVTIRGFIIDQNSYDDGTSIEFAIDVTSAVERER